MARRRKKSKAASQAKSREKDGSPMITDKSLPALPPHAIPPNAFSDTRVDPDSDTPTELSPRPRPAYRNDSSSRTSSRPGRSSERPSEAGAPEGLGLPTNALRNKRNSMAPSSSADTSSVDDGFFIPVALDPNSVGTNTPRSGSEHVGEPQKRKDRDYLNNISRTSSDKRSESQGSTPHIAFQEKGRQPSSDAEQAKLPLRKPSSSSRAEDSSHKSSPAPDDRARRTMPNKAQPAAEEFKLQDAPKSKKAAGSRSTQSPPQQTEEKNKGANGTARKELETLPAVSHSDSPPSHGGSDHGRPSRSSQDSRPKEEDLSADLKAPARAETAPAKSIARKELPPAARQGTCELWVPLKCFVLLTFLFTQPTRSRPQLLPRDR